MSQQLNVVELGRRRRWSEDEKLRIVMESLEAPRLGGPSLLAMVLFEKYGQHVPLNRQAER